EERSVIGGIIFTDEGPELPQAEDPLLSREHRLPIHAKNAPHHSLPYCSTALVSPSSASSARAAAIWGKGLTLPAISRARPRLRRAADAWPRPCWATPRWYWTSGSSGRAAAARSR